MDQDKGLVLLVTETNPQSQLFVEYLRQQLECAVNQASPQYEEGLINDACTVILLDTDHMDESMMQTWQRNIGDSEQVMMAAINVRDEDHAVELLTIMNLQGVFYRSESLTLLCKGLEALLEGRLWMSRAVMARLLQFFRRQQLNSFRPVCGLTHREMEIIALLGTGASNSEIAEQLFVSEHTVKSHLYNVFRKINVHNRLQAVNWARHNLGAPLTYVRRRNQEAQSPQTSGDTLKRRRSKG
ncbi:DNA-binding response regulator [Billgrantia azerbaijanica]|nr:DNA-binding response regulator [Halomonas azerbaijanica]